MRECLPVTCLFLVVALSNILIYACIIFSFFLNILESSYSIKFYKLQKLHASKSGKTLIKFLILLSVIVRDNLHSFYIPNQKDLTEVESNSFIKINNQIFDLLDILFLIINLKKVKN